MASRRLGDTAVRRRVLAGAPLRVDTDSAVDSGVADSDIAVFVERERGEC
jgi:hypothetical protein